jgi:beta-lactamase regulating signal transducer with metallopeptidase domain
MKLLLEMLPHPLAHRLGWALLHSLWQGALVAVVFGLLRFTLRRASARARYLAGCFSLFLLTAAPVITFLLIEPTAEPATWRGGNIAVSGTAPAIIASEGAQSSRVGGSATLFVFRSTEFLEQAIPWLVATWVIGVALCSLRLTQGCWRLNALKTKGIEPLDSGWIEMLNDLKRRLNISRPVQLFKSALVDVPTVVGWLRPVILLPASSLTGLTPSQLEAILAHELAHVVRHDYLINVFQNVVETLMFYHPAVWWISRCIRDEREHCCDDLAVQLCGDRVVYASALATMEELRWQAPQLALAASGGSLLNRIRRLAGLSPDAGNPGWRQPGGLALLGIGSAFAILGICLLMAPARYQAVTRIRSNPESRPAGLAGEKNKSNDDPFYLETEVDTIGSPIILDRVVADLELNYEWGRRYNGGAALKIGETVDRLKHSLDLRPVRGRNLIEIRVVSDQPREAANLANGIAETYRAHRLAQSFEMLSNGMAALRKEWDQQQELVHQAQTNLDRLREEFGITESDPMSLTPTPTFSTEIVRQLQSQLAMLKAMRVSDEMALQRLTNLTRAQLREAIQIVLEHPDSELSTLIAQSDLAHENLIKVGMDHTPENRVYTAAKDIKDQWDGKVNARLDGIMIGLQAKLDRTIATVNELSQQLENARTNDLALAKRSRPYYAEKQKLQDMLDFKKFLGMKIASEKTDLALPRTAQVEILERAVPPLQPVSSNRFLGAGLLVAGSLLGLTGIVMLRRTPRTDSAPTSG